MHTKYTKSVVISSLFWKFLERIGMQSVQLVVQIVLARLLLPKDFGLIAIVSVLITFANVFIQSGFNNALIQKKDADEKDFSSALYLSLLIAFILYVIFFISSNYIALFYQEEQLVSIIRILSINLFLGAFISIQNAYIVKHMMFKKLFFSSLVSILISGIAGIISAYMGCGVWALVIQQITIRLSIFIILCFIIKWKPRLQFSFTRIKILLSFGSKLLAANFIRTLYMDIRTLVIGKVYKASILGFYNRGENFPKTIVNNIDSSIQTVMFSTFSANQDNKKMVKAMVKRTITSSSFLIFPAMIGLAVGAESLVKIILTEKWLASVPFLQIFCISYAMTPIQNVNIQAISAIGRSDIILKIQIIVKVISFIILFISIPFGIYVIAFGTVISEFISMIVHIYPIKKLLDYSYYEQLKDIFPSLLMSILMGAIVNIFNFVNIPAWQILVIQIFAGIIIYIGMAKIFKVESLNYLINSIKNMMAKTNLN